MRTTTRLLTALLSLAAATATAQTVKETLDVTRQAVETRPIDERANRLVVDFVASAASLSDAQAKAMLAEALEVDEGRLKLRRDFMDRMGKVIPPRKLVRFFQIENKLDSVVRADISKQIPLAP